MTEFILYFLCAHYGLFASALVYRYSINVGKTQSYSHREIDVSVLARGSQETESVVVLAGVGRGGWYTHAQTRWKSSALRPRTAVRPHSRVPTALFASSSSFSSCASLVLASSGVSMGEGTGLALGCSAIPGRARPPQGLVSGFRGEYSFRT
eukprot:COSAG05_NODE_1596_length_4455_cov_3.362259_4_plen_152_part_00